MTRDGRCSKRSRARATQSRSRIARWLRLRGSSGSKCSKPLGASQLLSSARARGVLVSRFVGDRAVTRAEIELLLALSVFGHDTVPRVVHAYFEQGAIGVARELRKLFARLGICCERDLRVSGFMREQVLVKVSPMFLRLRRRIAWHKPARHGGDDCRNSRDLTTAATRVGTRKREAPVHLPRCHCVEFLTPRTLRRDGAADLVEVRSGHVVVVRSTIDCLGKTRRHPEQRCREDQNSEPKSHRRNVELARRFGE